MSDSFKRRLATWLINLLNAFLSGLAGGFLTAVGVTGTNAFVPGLIKDLSPHQMIVICIVSGCIGLFQFIRTPGGGIPSLDTFPGNTPTPDSQVTK